MKFQKRLLPVILVLGAALLVIALSIIWSGEAIAHCEALAVEHCAHPELLSSIRNTGYVLLVLGGAAAVSVLAIVFLFWHQLRRSDRSDREAEALRAKNEALEAMSRQARELAHIQRLETIGTLTSSIAHEFNNLLTPIMGYSMLALEKIPPEEELYDDLLEIYNASNKAKTIISRLSDLSRKNSSSTFRQVSIDRLVKKTLDVALPAKPSRVEIRLNLNCWDQPILANEIQINQLLLNLVINAYHAMEDTGGILSIATIFDESHVRIRVKDTGCGIPGDKVEKIFDPFFTTKEAGKGTGLGLAIAAQVIEDHKGRIEVKSQEGQGTTFTVWLPRDLGPEGA